MQEGILSIALWELFKRLVKPQTLTRLISKNGEEGLKRWLAENENGEAGIRATADAMERAESDFEKGEWRPIGDRSSNVDGIKYDVSSSTLTVLFASGTIYEYYDVPYDTAERFYYHKDSMGVFLNDEIKGRAGKGTSLYSYAKISTGNTTFRSLRTNESGFHSTHHKKKPRRR